MDDEYDECSRLRDYNWTKLSTAYWRAIDLGVRDLAWFIIDLRTPFGHSVATALSGIADASNVLCTAREDETFAFIWAGTRVDALQAIESLSLSRPVEFLTPRLRNPSTDGKHIQIVVGRKTVSCARVLWPVSR